MTPEELIKYELPSFAEFISIGWMQTILGWYYGRKVRRKIRRYNKRLKREEFIKSQPLQENNK
jgi:hypothetical protein